jgi:hypothetical protein
LDKEQRATLAELQFYAQEQKLLTEKLMEQERMLQIVQKDISERENLINFVFKERLESVGLGSTIMRGSAKDSLGASVEYGALANTSMRRQGGGGDDMIDIHVDEAPRRHAQPSNRSGAQYEPPAINDEDLGLDEFAERSERSETDSVGGASSMKVELKPRKK